MSAEHAPPVPPPSPGRPGLMGPWMLGLALISTALGSAALGAWLTAKSARENANRQLDRAAAEIMALRGQLDTLAGQEGRQAFERLLLDHYQAGAAPGAEGEPGRPEAVAAQTRMVMLMAKWLRQGKRAPGQVTLPAPGSSDPAIVRFPDGTQRTVPAAIAEQVRGIRGGPG